MSKPKPVKKPLGNVKSAGAPRWTANTTELERILGLSRPTILSLERDGILKRDGRSTANHAVWNLETTVLAFCDFQRSQIAALKKAPTGDLKEAKRRKLDADAAMSELRLEIMRGQWGSVADPP